MAHFGVLSYKGTGHLNPLIALSRQLMSRGHRVTFFHKSTALASRISALGPAFVPLPDCMSCAGHNPGKDSPDSSKSSRQDAAIRRITDELEATLRDAPEVLTHAQLDTLVVDEIVLSGPTLAEILRLPYFIVATSVPHWFGWPTPRVAASLDAKPSTEPPSPLEISAVRMHDPVLTALNALRSAGGLGPYQQGARAYPPLRYITQMPACLNLPQTSVPSDFSYAGPFVDSTARAPVPFPWEQLDGRPIIYASLGTAWKDGHTLFSLIAEACSELEVQLVISLGGRQDPAMIQTMPGNPLVLREVPQLEILHRTAAVITHAGLNTALEALLHGKPMLAIPRFFDQPAVAARLVQKGAAIQLSLDGITARAIRTALAKLLAEASYRDAAERLQMEIHAARGLQSAADLMEAALREATN